MTKHNYEVFVKIKEENEYGKQKRYLGHDLRGYYGLVDKSNAKDFMAPEKAKNAWQDNAEEIIKREEARGMIITKVSIVTIDQTITETEI